MEPRKCTIRLVSHIILVPSLISKELDPYIRSKNLFGNLLPKKDSFNDTDLRAFEFSDPQIIVDDSLPTDVLHIRAREGGAIVSPRPEDADSLIALFELVGKKVT